jgi:hypothetical protein
MARRGDTKPLCHVAQMIVALSGVSLWPLSGGKSLVLCQGAYTNHISVPRDTAVA